MLVVFGLGVATGRWQWDRPVPTGETVEIPVYSVYVHENRDEDGNVSHEYGRVRAELYRTERDEMLALVPVRVFLPHRRDNKQDARLVFNYPLPTHDPAIRTSGSCTDLDGHEYLYEV